jgi:hypothetical protein
LRTLAIEPTDFGFLNPDGYDEKYLNFLKMNSHVKKFDIGMYSFKPDFFEIIGKFNS